MSLTSHLKFYLDFQRRFGRNLEGGELRHAELWEWVAGSGKENPVTSRELYQVATVLSQNSKPRLPVRLWVYRLRYMLGLPPLDELLRYRDFINTQPIISPLLGEPWSRLDKGELHLDEASPSGQYDGSDAARVALQEKIDAVGADYVYGGYARVRRGYTMEGRGRIIGVKEGDRERNLHLGIDIWAPAGTPVHAPLSGQVFGVAVNHGLDDFGPTLVLRHCPKPGLNFFTIYGQLDRKVLNRMRVGTNVKAGRRIGIIGDHVDNGGWPPHLHFQLNLDLLGARDRFFGCGFEDERPMWMGMCPDPQDMIR